MRRLLVLATTLLLALATRSSAQPSRAASMDALLEHLVGRWRMTGSVRGKPVTYTMDGTRVLERQFVELHMLDVSRRPDYDVRHR